MTDTTIDTNAPMEKLAAIEHERWADWQKYLHSKCHDMELGFLTIPAELVAQWERQIATPYAELSEKEKQSDRDQVARYWPLIEALTAERDAWKQSSLNADLNLETEVAALTTKLEQAEQDRDRWEDAEIKAKCDWADDHENLVAQLEQHQWHRVADTLPPKEGDGLIEILASANDKVPLVLCFDDWTYDNEHEFWWRHYTPPEQEKQT